jgi:hypothetical protein
MHCLPIDDLCHLERDHKVMIEEKARDNYVYENAFELGTFNGRRYVYTWLDNQPVILIDNEGQLYKEPDIMGE